MPTLAAIPYAPELQAVDVEFNRAFYLRLNTLSRTIEDRGGKIRRIKKELANLQKDTGDNASLDVDIIKLIADKVDLTPEEVRNLLEFASIGSELSQDSALAFRGIEFKKFLDSLSLVRRVGRYKRLSEQREAQAATKILFEQLRKRGLTPSQINQLFLRYGLDMPINAPELDKQQSLLPLPNNTEQAQPEKKEGKG